MFEEVERFDKALEESKQRFEKASKRFAQACVCYVKIMNECCARFGERLRKSLEELEM